MELELCVLGKLTATVQVPESLRVLEPGEDDCGLSLIRIVNQKDGDKRIVWDGTDFAQIKDAKKLFDQLIEQGMVPYVVDPSGQRTPEVMTEFDPLAEEVVLAEDKRPRRREIVAVPEKMLAGG